MPAQPQSWCDRIFKRETGGVDVWHVKNPVQSVLPFSFACREDADAWIAKQQGYRAHVERWARVIDDRLWTDFDADREIRQDCGDDAIFASLAKAIPIHKALAFCG